MSGPAARTGVVVMLAASYAVLGGFGAWCMSLGGYAPWPDDGLAVGPLAHAVGWGLLVGVAGQVACWPLRNTRAFRMQHVLIHETIPEIGWGNFWAILPGAVLAEEVFFRGWLQPAMGLILASAAFGLGHFHVLRKDFWPVPLTVAGFGAALGLLYRWTGHLVAPFVAHLVFNSIAVGVIALAPRETPDAETSEPPDESG